MRHGRMRALPRNNNPEIVAGRHNGAGAHAELALLHARPVMHAKDGVHGEARKQAVVYHPFGADVPFLGWLEYNVHHAIQVAMLRQVTRRSQQHGGMAILAPRSEAHTYEIQRLMRTSYAVSCQHKQT